MSKKNLSTAIRLLVGGLFLMGCSLIQLSFLEMTPKLASQPSSIRGAIMNITKIDGKVSGIFVVGALDPDTTYERAGVAIMAKTRIWLRETAKYTRITPDDLQVGQLVAALFTGPVRESEPVQATAEEIVVLR